MLELSNMIIISFVVSMVKEFYSVWYTTIKNSIYVQNALKIL